MKISQFILGCAITIAMLSAFACRKAMPPNPNNGNDTTAKQTCNPQHECPSGYICDSGYCKKQVVICSCSDRPIPPECAAMCGP